MKSYRWFQTDLGYEATRQKLSQARNIIGDMEPSKGRLTFQFKTLKDFTVQITTSGKLGIFYPETSNYNVVLEQLKPFLVKADNTPAKIISPIESSKLKDKPSRFGSLFYIIFFVIFLVTLSMFSIAYVDPSLKLLNETVINPTKAFVSYAFWPIVGIIIVYVIFKSRRDRRH